MLDRPTYFQEGWVGAKAGKDTLACKYKLGSFAREQWLEGFAHYQDKLRSGKPVITEIYEVGFDEDGNLSGGRYEPPQKAEETNE